jgi:hypothetical protein
VKYAQCVKILLFLIDTILNRAIVQLLMKKKGDACCVGTSRISGKLTTPCDNSCGASMGTLEHMRMCTNR